MREQILHLGVPSEAILVEECSLQTRESAQYTLRLLKARGVHRIILVTSPFHQLRTYLTFAKVYQPHRIVLLNYCANTGEWHPATWFLSRQHRRLVRSEQDRIRKYRKKAICSR
jgi:uncharacterized SAM-binding protein YcdF (DUF218 family)